MKRLFVLTFSGDGWGKYLRCVGKKGIGKDALASALNCWLSEASTRHYEAILDDPGSSFRTIRFTRAAIDVRTGQTLLTVS